MNSSQNYIQSHSPLPRTEKRPEKIPPSSSSSRDSQPKSTPIVTSAKIRKSVSVDDERSPKRVKKMCREFGCENAAGKGGKCDAHAGRTRCFVRGCLYFVLPHSGGRCEKHSKSRKNTLKETPKAPEVEESPDPIVKERCGTTGCHRVSQAGGMCLKHGGGRRCGMEGCAKFAQTGGFCIKHGGGRRCGVTGCHKFAQRKGVCISHGGSRYTRQYPRRKNNERPVRPKARPSQRYTIKSAIQESLRVEYLNPPPPSPPPVPVPIPDPLKKEEDTPTLVIEKVKAPKLSIHNVEMSKGKRKQKGERVCEVSGCKRLALEEGKCYNHGGGRSCRYPGCRKRVKRGGRCLLHGGCLV
jgi:hypothetical protein